VIGQTIFGAELLVTMWAEQGVHISFGGVLLQVVLPNGLVREYLLTLDTPADISDNSVHDTCHFKLLSFEGNHNKWSKMSTDVFILDVSEENTASIFRIESSLRTKSA
jgi:hypothetical protein